MRKTHITRSIGQSRRKEDPVVQAQCGSCIAINGAATSPEGLRIGAWRRKSGLATAMIRSSKGLTASSKGQGRRHNGCAGQ